MIGWLDQVKPENICMSIWILYKAFIYAIDFDCIENELWSVLHWGVREFFANLIYKFDSFAHAKCEESLVEPKKQEINMNNWHESVNLACDWTDQRWNVRHIPYENRKPTAKSPKTGIMTEEREYGRRRVRNENTIFVSGTVLMWINGKL